MFNVNDIVVCKDEYSYLYGVTNEYALLLIMDVPKEGNDKYQAKVIFHKTEEGFVGTIMDFAREVMENDFEMAGGGIADEARDRGMVNKDWVLNKSVSISEVMPANIYHIMNSVDDRISTSLDENDMSQFVYRQTRYLFSNFHPENFEKLYNDGYSIIGGLYNPVYSKEEAIVSINNYIKGYFPFERFAYTAPDLFDTVIEEIKTEVSEKYEIVEIPYSVEGFSHKHRIIAFINKECNNFISYLTNYVTIEMYTYTAAWYLEKYGIVHNEAVKNALLASDKLAYFKALTEVVSTYAGCIDKLRRDKMLREFSNKYTGILMKPLQHKENELKNNIQNTNEKLSEYYSNLRDVQLKLFYYNTKQGVEDEFLDYISKYNDGIISVRTNNSSIVFDILTYMTYWDDDVYKSIRESDHRFRKMTDAMKQLFDDIFYTRKVKLRIEQKFVLDLTRCRVYTDSDMSYRASDGEGNHGMRNPHMQRYSCFGTHESIIKKYISEGNILQAFNQSVAACSGLTWTDGPVTNQFFDYMCNNDSYDRIPCLEMEDGTLMSIQQYVKKFKEEGGVYKA